MAFNERDLDPTCSSYWPGDDGTAAKTRSRLFYRGEPVA